MTETEKNFNKWFDEYADGVQVFEETDMKMAYLQGCADEVEKWIKAKEQLEAQIEKMKSQYDYAFNQLCESREIICLMLSQHKNKKEIDYSTKERGEKLLKQGVYKYD